MRRYNNDNEMSTGRLWVNVCAQALSHITIVLACVLAVIYFCDMYNRGEMGLLNNSMTRTMLMILCALSVAGSLMHLSSLRRLKAIREYFRLRSRKKR